MPAKKTTKQTAAHARKEAAALKKKAMAEYKKVKKQMDATTKKVGDYVKKNPEKSAAIAAGVGAALGAITALIARSRRKK